MQDKVLRLDPRDTVIIALTDLKQGESVSVDGQTYDLATDVAAKHKFSTKAFSPGDPIFMYGVMVGRASAPSARARPSPRSTSATMPPRSTKNRNRSTGTRPTYRNGNRAHSRAICVPMARWAREIIGWLCRWCFAKTATCWF